MMSFFSRAKNTFLVGSGMPLALKVGILTFSAGAFISWTVNGWRLGETIAKMERDQETALQVATTKALEETERMQNVLNAELQKARDQATKNAAVATRLRVESNGLRDKIARGSTITDSARPALDAYAETLGNVFSECVREYSEVAGKADSHALDASTLYNAWRGLKDGR
jgi:hypothetical protein